VTWLGLEADQRLRSRLGPHLRHEELELSQAAGVAGCANLFEQPHRRELRVALQASLDDRLEGLQLRRFRAANRRTDLPRIDVAFELTLGDPAVDGPSGNPQLAGDAGLREALLQIVCE
jgi:hypothetical protein